MSTWWWLWSCTFHNWCFPIRNSFLKPCFNFYNRLWCLKNTYSKFIVRPCLDLTLLQNIIFPFELVVPSIAWCQLANASYNNIWLQTSKQEKQASKQTNDCFYCQRTDCMVIGTKIDSSVKYAVSKVKSKFSGDTF